MFHGIKHLVIFVSVVDVIKYCLNIQKVRMCAHVLTPQQFLPYLYVI